MCRMRLLIVVLVLVGCVGLSSALAAKRDYRFDGKISREVLENYLSRSNTMLGMFHNPKAFDENLRMVKNIEAKYLGRVIYRWGGEANFEDLIRQAKPLAAKAH